MAAKGPVVIQFLPSSYNPKQPRDKATAKQIRSHIAGNLRRKKLEVLLNPTLPTSKPTTTTTLDAQPQSPKPAQQSLASSFCTCVVIQNTSPVREDAKSKALQKQRAIADSYKICQRCHKVRFLELSWLGQLKTARQRVPSVSPFLESEFDPFESLPELSYYKQSPQAKRLMNEFKAHMVMYMPYEILRSVVLSAAANDPALYMGLLYSSCCHLEAVREGGQSPLSMAIKTEAMRQINIRLNDEERRNTTETLVAIAYMSSGVFAIGAENVIAETEAHEDGMMRIWYQGLGAKVPDHCMLGKVLIRCLVLHKMSRAATLAQPIDPGFISAFCQASRMFSPLEFLPESPVYNPRADFYTIKKSSKCTPYILAVLYGLKNLVDYLIEEPNPGPDVDINMVVPNFSYEVCRKEMLALPSAALRTAPEKCRGDYIYECLRVVATMLIYCVDMRVSLAHLPERFVVELKEALQKTDLGGYWGTMSGLYFFVAMIGSAAAMRKPQHGFMGTIIARADHEIVYGNAVFEGATIAAWRLQRVHLELLSRWEESVRELTLSGLDLGLDDFGSGGTFL